MRESFHLRRVVRKELQEVTRRHEKYPSPLRLFLLSATYRVPRLGLGLGLGLG